MFVVYRHAYGGVDKVMQAFAGTEHSEFMHCELYLPDSGGTFTIFKGRSMERWADMPQLYIQKPHLFAWHLIPLNYDEYMRMHNWNVQEIALHCPYNFRDLMWQILPKEMRQYCVKDLGDNKSQNPNRMFCSQAVILALRAACGGDGSRPRLLHFVHSMNSRLTTPSDLARMNTNYLGMSVNYGPVPTDAFAIGVWLQCAVRHMQQAM